jgi:hypothetical protein
MRATDMDTFHISSKQGIVTILAQSEDLKPSQQLIDLGFTYAPIVVITHTINEDQQAYTIASQAGFDLVWLRSALSRFDAEDWIFAGEWLVSPVPSRLDHPTLLQILRQGIPMAV